MSSEDDRSAPIPLRVAGETTGIARRTALQVLAASAGAALGLPSEALGQHPMHTHLSNPGALEQARQKAAVTTNAPQFADAHQMKTLEALAEAIVPGSTKARVAPFLDQLVAVESPANQRAFLGALGAFDMAAIDRHRKPWIALSASEQDALLQQASTGDARTTALSGHFQNLKTWVAGAYYSSEIGMRELGWTGNTFHQQLPGCTHPGSHQD